MGAGTIEQQLARLPLQLQARFVVDQRDRPAWGAARSRAIGASTAAKFARLESVPLYTRDVLHNPFTGNAATAHGNQREPHMLRAYNTPQNTLMFRAAKEPRFVATPDGIVVGADGSLVLVQCKTTNKDFRRPDGSVAIPRGYYRQCWWEQMVIGAARTLFVWEVNENGRVLDMEPQSDWIHPDPDELTALTQIGNGVLAALDDYDSFTATLAG